MVLHLLGNNERVGIEREIPGPSLLWLGVKWGPSREFDNVKIKAAFQRVSW